jgi:nitrate/nitrite transporter NarK
MVTQSFLYNAVFFTYALVLARFYGVAPERVGLFLVPFAIGNFVGPLLLGRLFDTVGRRVMIASTYAIAAALLALTGWLFAAGHLTATTQTLLWTAVFFFASAGASSAYLTVSEIFPSPGRRCDRTVGVRAADRGVRPERVPRLPRRSRHDGARRRGRVAPRRRRRAAPARGDCATARLALTRAGTSSMLVTQM